MLCDPGNADQRVNRRTNERRPLSIHLLSLSLSLTLFIRLFLLIDGDDAVLCLQADRDNLVTRLHGGTRGRERVSRQEQTDREINADPLSLFTPAVHEAKRHVKSVYLNETALICEFFHSSNIIV